MTSIKVSFLTRYFLATALIATVIGGATSCSDSNQEGISNPKSHAATTPRIAVLQAKPQEWADAMTSGFYAGLEESGLEPGKNVTVVVKSANGDPVALSSLASQLAVSDYDLVFTLGTQASESYFAAMKRIPMLFGAVTDPKSSGFYLDNALTKPAKDLTGSQDLWPYPAQFSVIRRLLPTAKKIGVIYSSGETNTDSSMVLVRKAASAQGFDILEKAIPSPDALEGATQSLLVSGCSAIYIPADNTVQSNSAIVIQLATRMKVPVFTGIAGIVGSGALATVGTNYFEVGKVNGRQASQVLGGEAARNIPPAIATDGDLVINIGAAKAIGLTIPEDLLRSAKTVIDSAK